MKEIAIIVGFAAFTAVPPIIAGLGTPAASPPEPGVASYADDEFLSLSGAICSSRPSRKAPTRADAALLPESLSPDIEETQYPLPASHVTE